MKKAFSLIEIGIMLFVVTAVFFVVVPFSVSNVKQAKFISDWKLYMNEVQYSFESLLEYKKTNKLDNVTSVTRLMDYLDAKKIDINNAKINHTYRMLNGKKFGKNNFSDFDEIYKDSEDKLIGVEYNDILKGKSCTEMISCATVWVDINGKQKPNIVGNDIFLYSIYSDRAEPYGRGIPVIELKKDCSISGTGAYCSNFYIIGGDIH